MIIGLTGGIGSGKTTCSDWFASQGIPIIDADQIARQIVEPGQTTLQTLVSQLGKSILQQDGSLNRAMLRQKIFTDMQIKKRVDAIMHPAIRENAAEALQQAEKSHDIVMYSAPLLLENELDKDCAAIIIVDISEYEQLKRASQRDGVSQAEIARIIDNQIPRQQRLSKANYIINNTGTLEFTYQQCQQIMTQLQKSTR